MYYNLNNYFRKHLDIITQLLFFFRSGVPKLFHVVAHLGNLNLLTAP